MNSLKIKRRYDLDEISSKFNSVIKLKASLKEALQYRGADLNCRPQGYESCALTN